MRRACDRSPAMCAGFIATFVRCRATTMRSITSPRSSTRRAAGTAISPRPPSASKPISTGIARHWVILLSRGVWMGARGFEGPRSTRGQQGPLRALHRAPHARSGRPMTHTRPIRAMGSRTGPIYALSRPHRACPRALWLMTRLPPVCHRPPSGRCPRGRHPNTATWLRWRLATDARAAAASSPGVSLFLFLGKVPVPVRKKRSFLQIRNWPVGPACRSRSGFVRGDTKPTNRPKGQFANA